MATSEFKSKNIYQDEQTSISIGFRKKMIGKIKAGSLNKIMVFNDGDDKEIKKIEAKLAKEIKLA